MEEIWKDIKKFPKYQISNYGNIKNKKTNKILKTYKNSLYINIKLYKDDKKSHRVNLHRLIAETFIPNPYNLPCVNHKDGNKKNNNIENLEWCTYSYNTKEAFRLGIQKTWCGTKFGKDHPNYKFRGKWPTQKRIIQLTKEGKKIKIFNSASEVERILKINSSHIREVCKGKRKTAGGYIWQDLN